MHCDALKETDHKAEFGTSFYFTFYCVSHLSFSKPKSVSKEKKPFTSTQGGKAFFFFFYDSGFPSKGQSN